MRVDFEHLNREELEELLMLWQQTSQWSDSSGDPLEDPGLVATANRMCVDDLSAAIALLKEALPTLLLEDPSVHEKAERFLEDVEEKYKEM